MKNFIFCAVFVVEISQQLLIYDLLNKRTETCQNETFKTELSLFKKIRNSLEFRLKLMNHDISNVG